ncbi:uncharacterized protein BJX67DRAFT_387468 [Aspergillus lucknowensis]|uniref:EGF-like domain-containing protein n=1 Tax=Aspergillus lucknowensis TaxID=176173 RepID=A0ABR4LV93_9EURO
MDPRLNGMNSRSDPRTAQRKGSVRRAREMLEAGATQFGARTAPQTTGWPLSRRLSNIVDSQGRLLSPRAPPPSQRPPRHDLPSPSIYSERSVSDAVPSPLHVQHSGPSFPEPSPGQTGIHPALREPVPAAGETVSRKSAADSVSSIPSIPDFPPPLPPSRTGNLGPPPPLRSIMNRGSSVSPIPEELPDSPTITNNRYAHSEATASSWNSQQRESDILGAYLDSDSDGAQQPSSTSDHGEVTLVRQASLGKRGKPSLRTISKPNVGAPQMAGNNGESGMLQGQDAGASLKEIAAGLQTRDSFGSSSSEESQIDPEKPPIVLGDDRGADRSYDNNTGTLEGEAGTLPKSTPTMSEARPGARRPPRLNMSAVREAEARGSLTSLSDLIKRATKLATNLEHGRTASRNDLLNVGGGSKPPFHGDPNRKSGSIKDILASFPNPAATPEGRSSWPVFWRKSTLQQSALYQLNSQERDQEASQEKRRRRCCGIPLWAFIVVCVILLLIVAAAVLIPIFLIVVPRESQSSDGSTTCARASPCANGGVSVSSGDVCSCVCVNGYTGSRCTTTGDASCVSTEIAQGSTSRNATVGDDLPRLFQESQSNFSIPLDPITIMALFSQNNVSCTTENALVSFKGLSSNGNDRRSQSLDFVVTDQFSPGNEDPPPSAVSYVPTATVPARRSVVTENGIVYEDSPPSDDDRLRTADPTHTPTATPSVSPEVVDFSRVAVLYILQKTGALNAAMLSAESIQNHLEHSHLNSTDENFMVDLAPSGVKGDITLDFDAFTITDFDGKTVGEV